MLMHKAKEEQIKLCNNNRNPEHSANRTMEKAIQSANETGEDIGKVGSKITSGAKDMVGNIGEKLQDLGK